MKLVEYFKISDFFFNDQWHFKTPVSLWNAEQISSLSQVITIFIGFFLIFFVYHNAKRDNVLKSYIFMNLSMITWTIGLAFENITTSRTYLTRFGPLWFSYLGICAMGPGWLIFCLFLTENKWACKRKNIFLLFIPHGIFYVLLLTNYFHQFMYIVPLNGPRSFGPAYYALFFTVVVYFVAGLILLAKKQYEEKQRIRHKIFFMVILVAIIIVNLILQLLFNWNIEIKPLLFVLFSSVFFFYGSLRYNFFSIVPVSFSSLINSMDDGVLILDADSNIVSFNNSLTRLISEKDVLRKDTSALGLIDHLKEISQKTSESQLLLDSIMLSESRSDNSILNIKQGITKFFKVDIQSISNRKGQLLSKIVVFTDVTEFNNLNMELENKNNEILSLNQQLMDANEELLRQSLISEEIAITNERNRILKELYTSIEDTFKDILNITEICRQSILNNDGNVEVNLKRMIQTTKDGLSEIRSSIYYQKNKLIENDIFIKTLEKLLAGKSNMNIQIFFEGAKRGIPYHIRYAIYITCRETLENSCAKRQANTVYIILQTDEASFNMIITDDGKGYDNLESDKGLKLIENLCHELGGTISYGSLDENQGFSLHMELPFGSINLQEM
ncbi:sensor histidine kinase [Acetivibrio cellulolyticus]|uniref:sensor histidine kinase n=1 Tax=Acetivibrio cellulolyticus TaxID=35830 RepID=UPI0001E304B7|nr:histidine kinase N-terminal 7TM domain-containing protein [Acetivibrio cellulolyticus]